MHHHLQPDDSLLLRSWSIRDAPAMQALVEANLDHLRLWLPWPDERSTLKGAEDFIQSAQFSAIGSGNRFYGIWENGELVGEIARTGTSMQNRFCSMSYWLAAPAQGRGIVQRSAVALLAYNFGQLDLNRVEIRVATGNERSRAVVERLGFRHEGLLRQVEWIGDRFMDHEVFSLLKPEWDALHPAG